MTFVSIRLRLLAWSAGLTAFALVLAYLVLSALLSDFVDRRLQAELRAHARAVMAAADWDASGQMLSIAPPPADPRFDQPLSGWYWQVGDGSLVLSRSPSLITGSLGANGQGRSGPDGVSLMTLAEAFTAPGNDRRLIVTVSLPAAEAAAELQAIRLPVLFSLVTLAMALLAAHVLAIRAGLVDLTRFTNAVSALRDGRSEALPEAGASELRPLASELSRLVQANRTQIERARAHAGDLAHALKTPLAILANRASAKDAALIERMERMIRWHLKRARAQAAGLDPTLSTPVAPVLQDLLIVLGPEAGRRGIIVHVEAAHAPDFRGDADDLAEIIDAIAENAVKWAQSRVEIVARGDGDQLIIEVADDGPGIPADQRENLLGRGVRLDESAPGHGLGLAIAKDRCTLYGGELALSTGRLGGLLVALHLPARHS
jgi:signal transduction histidine kinase